MKTQPIYVQLEAETLQTVALRSSEMLSSVEVDEAAGIIRNCAVMTVGPALGYGWEVDSTTIQQTQALLGAKLAGAVMRFKHPATDATGRPADALGTDVGYLKNTRIVGNSVRGDVHLAEYAKNLPGQGDVWTYLLSKAKNDPAGMGLSAACSLTLEAAAGQNTRLVARMRSIDAVDFVGKPAANPNGLLSEPTKPPVSAGGTSKEPLNSGVLPMEPVIPAAPAAPVSPPTQTATLSAPVIPTTPTVVAPPAQAVAAINLAEQEKQRVTEINQLAAVYPDLPKSVVLSAIGTDCTLAQARQMFLKAIADANPVVTGVQPGSITVGHDQGRAAYLAAIPDAIQLRAGVTIEKPHELSQKLRGRRMIDMFKTLMVQLGVGFEQVMNISDLNMAGLITRPDIFAATYPQIYAQLAQSTDSFSNLLVDAMGKTLRKAYIDTPTTWQEWCGRDVAPDFKSKKFVQLSDAPGLVAKPEGAEIKYSVMSDSKETATLSTFSSGIILTREAVINDDLGAFNRIPMSQGGAAKRLEDDTAYAILTANAALADTVALFHATHSNLISATASTGAPTVTTLAATEALLLKQTGPKGAYLKLQAKNLIVPVALKTVATKLVRSVTDPAATASGVVNPYYNAYNVIPEPRLDANSATIWYLTADPGVIDTVTIVFLTDEPEPVLAQETKFDTLDAKFAVRHTIVGKAVDYRGMAKNPGA